MHIYVHLRFHQSDFCARLEVSNNCILKVCIYIHKDIHVYIYRYRYIHMHVCARSEEDSPERFIRSARSVKQLHTEGAYI